MCIRDSSGSGRISFSSQSDRAAYQIQTLQLECCTQTYINCLFLFSYSTIFFAFKFLRHYRILILIITIQFYTCLLYVKQLIKYCYCYCYILAMWPNMELRRLTTCSIMTATMSAVTSTFRSCYLMPRIWRRWLLLKALWDPDVFWSIRTCALIN